MGSSVGVSIQLFAPIKRDKPLGFTLDVDYEVSIQLFAPIKRDASQLSAILAISKSFHSIVCPY